MKTRPVVRAAIAIIWDGERVLTGRRPANVHLAGMREFPGGKIEPGESAAECVVREVREEVGVEIEIVGERPTVAYDYPDRRVVLYPFDARIVSGTPPGSVTWLALGDLAEDEFPPATGPLLAALRGGHPPRPDVSARNP